MRFAKLWREPSTTIVRVAMMAMILGVSCTPSPPDGRYACVDGRCPPGQHCGSDALCHRQEQAENSAEDPDVTPVSPVTSPEADGGRGGAQDVAGNSALGGRAADGGAGAGGRAAEGGAGASGRAAQGGAGGMGGMGGSAGMASPAPEHCENADMLRCVVAGSLERQKCDATSHTWVEAPACIADATCDANGACKALAEACRGQKGGDIVCLNADRHTCSADRLSTQVSHCKDVAHCQEGKNSACAPCIAGEHTCDGALLRVCNAAQDGWTLAKTCSSAALCNADIGDCTTAACLPKQWKCDGDALQQCNAGQTAFEKVKDCPPSLCDQSGGQCDVCAANGCTDRNTRHVCAADGQGFSDVRCPDGQGVCLGQGNCVQCSEATDCPQPADCVERTCIANQCGTRPRAVGAACSTGGVCNGTGLCGICVPGAKRCMGAQQPQVCSALGLWTNDKACDANAVCHDNSVGTSCTCNAGFRGDGFSCTDIDECADNSDNCDNNPEACVNTPGGFTCTCPVGYDGTGMGVDGCDNLCVMGCPLGIYEAFGAPGVQVNEQTMYVMKVTSPLRKARLLQFQVGFLATSTGAIKMALYASNAAGTAPDGAPISTNAGSIDTTSLGSGITYASSEPTSNTILDAAKTYWLAFVPNSNTVIDGRMNAAASGSTVAAGFIESWPSFSNDYNGTAANGVDWDASALVRYSE